MPPTSAAMELKVLINILQSGQGLKSILGQVNQVSDALTKLQAKANAASTAGGGGAGAGAVATAEKLAKASETASKGFSGVGKAAAGAAPGLATFEKAVGNVFTGLKFLAGGFLALQSIQFLKNIADTAARSEVLSTVLHVVGRNAGYTSEQIDRTSKDVQRLGITAQAANKSLTQFFQAGLDIKFAAPLARAAQDLAVISGMDSSSTFERLILNIQQLDTMGLRWMGIVTSMSEATAKYADQHHLVASALTQTQKQQALANEVLEKSKGLQGSYEAAMGDVGKQVTSLVRLFTTLKETLGKQLLPAYSALISELSLFLEKMNDTAEADNSAMSSAEALAEVVRFLAHWVFQLGLFLYQHKVLILDIAVAYGIWFLAASRMKILGFIVPILVNIWNTLVGITFAIIGASEAVVGLTGAVGLLETVLTGGVFLLIVAAIGAAVYGITKLTEHFLGASKAGQGLYDITRKLADARDEEQKARDEYVQKQIHGTLEEERVAKEAYDAAKKRRDDLQRARDKYEEDLKKSDPARYAEEQEFAKMRQRQIDQEKTRAAALAAREKLRVDISGGVVTPKDFAEGMTQTKAFIAELHSLEHAAMDAGRGLKGAGNLTEDFAGKIRDARLSVAESAKQQLGGVSDKESNKQYQEMLAGLKASYPDQTKLWNDLSKLSRLKISGGDTLTKPLRDLDELLFKEQKKRTQDAYKDQLDGLKTANGLLAAQQKTDYDKALMTLEEYFQARRVAQVQEYGLERAALLESISDIEQERGKSFSQGEQKQSELRQRLAEAQQRLRELDRKFGAGISGTNKEETDALTTRARVIHEIELQTAAAAGNEFDAQRQIAFEMQKEIEDAHAIGDVRAENAFKAKQELQFTKLHNEMLDQSLELSLKANTEKQKALDLEQARIDVARSLVQMEKDTGRITGHEAMVQNNALVLRQLAKDQLMLESQQFELTRRRAEYEDRRIAIIERMKRTKTEGNQNQGFSEFSPETTKAIQTELGAADTKIKELEKSTVQLDGAIRTAAGNLGMYGRDLQEHFVDGFADALTKSITDFQNAGKAWVSLSKSISDEIVGIFMKAFTERLFKKMGLFSFVDGIMNMIFGAAQTGPKAVSVGDAVPSIGGAMHAAEGGPVSGPGTGTSDSIPAMLSTGEHVMPASKAARWMPLLEGIRLGRLSPSFALGGPVSLQSIATGSVIPRRYAGGGVVVADGGASAVTPGGGGGGNMVVSLHPDTMNMTMREWLEHEVVRQHGRR